MGLFDRFRSKHHGDAGLGAELGRFRLAEESDGKASLTLDLGDLPTDAVVQAAGDEPNGAFWEGVASYVAPALAARLNMDSEGSMFAVYGDRTDLEQLCELLQPLVDRPAAMTGLLQRAQADGVLLEGYGR
jgi:hypothetical protein